jgi:hypothetical protein
MVDTPSEPPEPLFHLHWQGGVPSE